MSRALVEPAIRIDPVPPGLGAAHYASRLASLVRCAALEGYTVTIEQRPLRPLAMGNAETIITVRESHASYRSKG